jgi:excisionase family DNA binding protein
MKRLSYRIAEAVKATGISRPTLYRLISRGELSIFKIGTMTFIPAEVLEGFIERHRRGEPQ